MGRPRRSGRIRTRDGATGDVQPPVAPQLPYEFSGASIPVVFRPGIAAIWFGDECLRLPEAWAALDDDGSASRAATFIERAWRGLWANPFCTISWRHDRRCRVFGYYDFVYGPKSGSVTGVSLERPAEGGGRTSFPIGLHGDQIADAVLRTQARELLREAFGSRLRRYAEMAGAPWSLPEDSPESELHARRVEDIVERPVRLIAIQLERAAQDPTLFDAFVDWLSGGQAARRLADTLRHAEPDVCRLPRGFLDEEVPFWRKALLTFCFDALPAWPGAEQRWLPLAVAVTSWGGPVPANAGEVIDALRQRGLSRRGASLLRHLPDAALLRLAVLLMDNKPVLSRRILLALNRFLGVVSGVRVQITDAQHITDALYWLGLLVESQARLQGVFTVELTLRPGRWTARQTQSPSPLADLRGADWHAYRASLAALPPAVRSREATGQPVYWDHLGRWWAAGSRIRLGDIAGPFGSMMAPELLGNFEPPEFKQARERATALIWGEDRPRSGEERHPWEIPVPESIVAPSARLLRVIDWLYEPLVRFHVTGGPATRNGSFQLVSVLDWISGAEWPGQLPTNPSWHDIQAIQYAWHERNWQRIGRVGRAEFLARADRLKNQSVPCRVPGFEQGGLYCLQVQDLRRLQVEATRMEHCVYNYRRQLLSENTYIFSIGIRRGRKPLATAQFSDVGGRWALVQLLGWQNLGMPARNEPGGRILYRMTDEIARRLNAALLQPKCLRRSG